MRPRLPSHYYVLYEPPDSNGDEALTFVSERRKIKVKGTLFREFSRAIVPLLDGKHTVAEIQELVADTFGAQEVTAALELLAEQHLLAEDDVEDGLTVETRSLLEPQLNFFHEVSGRSGAVQRRLAEATVSVLSLSGPGVAVATGLAAAGVGHLRCIDASTVRAADRYLNPLFPAGDSGEGRASVLKRAILGRWPHAEVAVNDRPLVDDEQVLAAVRGSDVVICCTDPAEASLAYKLNRACMSAQIPWISCTVSGFEIILGPSVRPHQTACYLCYKMRSVACAENPEDEFSFQQFLDHRKRDDTDRRENLVFAVGLAANLLGLEALKLLTGIASPVTMGHILIVDALQPTIEQHVVLRHPRCPVCFSSPSPAPEASDNSASEAASAR
jgi:adenylyltransferase/sulfurtransferase